jgi:predicted alpha/beta-hydrolase family hydrolase
VSEQRVSHRFEIDWRAGLRVSAALETPPIAASRSEIPGLVLAHGAGGNLDTAFLVEMSEGLAARDIASLRFNFPYMENRRRIPDPAVTLEACYQAVARRGAELFPQGLFLGGKSMGGRIASQMVAHVGSDVPPVRGLIFLGYPLHAPGKQHQLRDQHLYDLRVPMLFIEGTRDAFADRSLLQGVLDRLADRAKVHWIEGGDHSFKVRGRKPAEVHAEILDAIAGFVIPK